MEDIMSLVSLWLLPYKHLISWKSELLTAAWSWAALAVKSQCFCTGKLFAPHTCNAMRSRLELVLCLLSDADCIWISQGEKDWQKYETARRLKKCVDKIRNQYREDWKSKEMKVRQRAVALYFIDKVRLTPSTLLPFLPCWGYPGLPCVCS